MGETLCIKNNENATVLANVRKYFSAVFGTNKRQENLGRVHLLAKVWWISLDIWGDEGHSMGMFGGHPSSPKWWVWLSILEWAERVEEFSNSGKSQKIWSVPFEKCYHSWAEDRVEGSGGAPKCMEHQDWVMSLKPRKEKLCRGRAWLESIKPYGSSFWFTHSFTKHSELPSLCWLYFGTLGYKLRPSPCP